MKCDNCGDEVKEYVKIESGEIYCPICNRSYLYGWQVRDEQIENDGYDKASLSEQFV
jgi:uncharacterized Zn finger protein (UPF0148 family)